MSEITLFLHEDGAANGVPQAMADFELANTCRLPDLYKKIAGRFDEASIYPNLFFPKMPPEVYDNIQSGANFSDFFSFETALAFWNGKDYGAGKPPGMFFLGSTGGGIEVVMSLRPKDHGAIYCWYHSTNIWGTDGNDDGALFEQAESLAAFLSSLTDTASKAHRAFIDDEDLEDAVTIDLSAPEWQL